MAMESALTAICHRPRATSPDRAYRGRRNRPQPPRSVGASASMGGGTRRRFSPAAGRRVQALDLPGLNRHRRQIALTEIAPQLPQVTKLLSGLDPFDKRGEPRVSGQLNGGGDDRRVVLSSGNPATNDPSISSLMNGRCFKRSSKEEPAQQSFNADISQPALVLLMPSAIAGSVDEHP
jgi:hypothetical protein